MKVLVTGGSSLLGRAVADQLVARGDRVTSFQRSPGAGTADDALGDVRDRSAVLAAADGHDAIVHLAALVAPRPAWSDAYAVNVTGTRHVVEAAVRCGNLVHVSSPYQVGPDHHRGNHGAFENEALGDGLRPGVGVCAGVAGRPHAGAHCRPAVEGHGRR